MYTLKTFLLDSCIFVLEPDNFQYNMYSHSLWAIQKHLLEETYF